MRPAIRQAVLYVTSRSHCIVFAASPLFALENIVSAWNQSVSGTFDFSKIVPAIGAM